MEKRSDKTTTRCDLIAKLARDCKLSTRDAKTMMEAFIDTLSNSIVQGHGCRIYGFGKFIISNKDERLGRNPLTKQEYKIVARNVVKFHPSESFKETVKEY